mgnify:CR=1 FL=1
MEDVLLGWEIDRKSRSYALVNYYSSMTNEAFDYSDKATRMSVYKRRKRRLIVRV